MEFSWLSYRIPGHDGTLDGYTLYCGVLTGRREQRGAETNVAPTCGEICSAGVRRGRGMLLRTAGFAQLCRGAKNSDRERVTCWGKCRGDGVFALAHRAVSHLVFSVEAEGRRTNIYTEEDQGTTNCVCMGFRVATCGKARRTRAETV
jgi:hypothetical protein